MKRDEGIRGIPGQPVAADLPRHKDKELIDLWIDVTGEITAVCATWGSTQEGNDFIGPRALEAAAAYATQLLLDEQYRREGK